MVTRLGLLSVLHCASRVACFNDHAGCAEVDGPLLEIATDTVQQLTGRLSELGLQEVTVRQFKSGAVAAKVRERIKAKDKQMSR